MTLVLAVANSDQVVQVSDRQLTNSDGRPCVLPENKATILTLTDARLLCGFAGLARVGAFRTGRWIVDALTAAASGNHLAHGTVERFTEAATERFLRPDLASVPPEHRGLSVLLTGYRDVLDRPKLIAALVTNYQNAETGQDELPWKDFRVTYWSARDDEATPTYIQRIGQWVAWRAADERRLRVTLEQRRPVDALIDLAVGVTREIAGRPTAGGTIGRDLSSAVLPPIRPPGLDRGEIPLISGFHPNGAAHVWHGVNQVISIADGPQLAVMDPQLEPLEKTPGTVIATRKVGRNKPCPCGSRKKYKKCHGA